MRETVRKGNEFEANATKAEKKKLRRKEAIDLDPERYLIEFHHKNGSKTRAIVTKNLNIYVDNAFLTSTHLKLTAFCKLDFVNMSNVSQSAYFDDMIIEIKPFEDMDVEKFMIFVHMALIIGAALILVILFARWMGNQEKEFEERVEHDNEMKQIVDELKMIAFYLRKLHNREKEKKEKRKVNRLKKRKENQEKFDLIGFGDDSSSSDDEALVDVGRSRASKGPLKPLIDKRRQQELRALKSRRIDTSNSSSDDGLTDSSSDSDIAGWGNNNKI